ncbi:MAG: hypothetical protein ACTHM1_13110 [Solirubrobacteraceae bacterium]
MTCFKRIGLVTFATGLVVLCAGVAPALAASPWWHLSTSVRPSVLKPGGEGSVVVQALNLGDAPTSGPVALAVALPAGMTVVSKKGVPQVSFVGPYASSFNLQLGPTGPVASLELCKATLTQVSCSTEPQAPGLAALAHIAPYEQLEMLVEVRSSAPASGGEYEARVSGGEAASVSRRRALPFGEAAPAFGADEYALVPEEEGGGVDTRAGSHPFQLTSSFALNQTSDPQRPPALAKDLHFNLPPGQVGNATIVPRCSILQFSTLVTQGNNLCPTDTAIGVASITIDEPDSLGVATYPTPIFNLETKPGEPARFGFVSQEVPVVLDTAVRSGTGEDYGVTVSASNITELANFISETVTFWGSPGDRRLDQSRGWDCLAKGVYDIHGGSGSCSVSNASSPQAFLTMPTSCEASYASTVTGRSWSSPEYPHGLPLPGVEYSLQDAFGQPLGLTGCNQLPFAPSIAAAPTSARASTPTGLEFDMYVDDEGLASGEGLAQSQLEKAVVALPQGVTTNPSVAAGLVACTLAQYDSENVGSTPGTGCPDESKIGDVSIESPLVSEKIEGSVFLAKQGENPFGSLLAIYVVAKNPQLGVMVRLAGKVDPNPVTGQLLTTFEHLPQLPFSHFHFKFRQGQQAPLANPSVCGTYTTTADLSPYSEPARVVHDSAQFAITQGAEGNACPSGGVPPFAPGLIAGMVDNSAGSYSPMYLQVTRKDAEQEITRFSAQLPPGLTANLSGIPFCPDADIETAKSKSGEAEEAEPSCPAASQIGHTEVGVGVGEVLAWSAGRLYLAGPYHGSPFSVVAVNSAKVGPFDLGTVVVREALSIDPRTAVVKIDAKGSDPIPHILDGIVIHARDIRVYVDRPNFALNPTSCERMSLVAAVDGAGADPSNPADQQQATVANSFQDANCARLRFKPSFKVFTRGRTNRKSGASLRVLLTYPNLPQGTQANISSVKVSLPQQLPSNLNTLKKACLAATFDADPAACPAESRVGTAKALTPILPVPLEGPAYFVSYGGAKFPELIVVLQGYGVRIDLHGETFITRSGVTSSTFKTVPDQPVASFELTLPQGKSSALDANTNLCAVKGGLHMPTVFTAQNGNVIRQSTPVTVTGCPRHKAHRASRHKQRRKHKR